MTDALHAIAQRPRTFAWWLPWYLAVALIATFLQPPIPLHSTRALAVAWDMWAHHQFWVPHLNGVPYPQKAPLLFWLIQAGWAALGVNAVWPRVLMVLIGATQLILARRLAQRLFPERPAIAHAAPWLLLALAYGFLYGLQIMYDGLLAVWVLAALLCLVPAAGRPRPRWAGFAVCIGLGLLTKGPVMLVHVVPVWLLGPWWCARAREQRARWYGLGFAAVLGGGVMLAAWVLPAVHLGGPAYAHNLLFKQTGGRVVDAFIHRRPFWWYLQWVPLLLFPFVLWPRMWAGAALLRRPLAPGLRMALAWLGSAFVIFSAFSGKQSYYLVPELPAAAIVMAAMITTLRGRDGRANRSAWLGAWPLALGALAFAVLLLVLSLSTATRTWHNHWLHDLATIGWPFGVLYLVLGALVIWPGRAELTRIALAGLIGSAGAYAALALAFYPAFDMRPAARLLARAQAHGDAIGNLGTYDGQFEFAGRMTRPIERLHGGQSLQAWAKQHPRGLVIAYPEHIDGPDLRYARLVQPYRGTWMAIWSAPVLATLRRGQTPPQPSVPTVLLPAPDYWRYAKLQ